MKNTTINFLFHKKNCLSDIPKMVVLAILRSNLRPLSGIENFLKNKFNSLVQFFWVKFTGNCEIVP